MSPVHLPPDTDDQRLARIAHAAVLEDEAEWLSGRLAEEPDTLPETIAAIAGAALAVLLVISAAVLWGT